MCIVKITRWACRCEDRSVQDCDKFKKRTDNSFWRMLVRARFAACSNTSYVVTPRKASCVSKDCPKKNRRVEKPPVVLKQTARGTTGFFFSPHGEVPPQRTRTTANVEQQPREGRTRDRRHDDHRQPSLPRGHRSGELRRTMGTHLPKKFEGTLDDPRTRLAENPRVELPKMRNVAGRREVLTVRPAQRLPSQHGVVVSDFHPSRAPSRAAHRSGRQPTPEPAQAPRPHRRESRTRPNALPPPVPMKNYMRRPPDPDVPLRPKAPVHEYEYRRDRRYHPVSSLISHDGQQEKRRSRIPGPIGTLKHIQEEAPRKPIHERRQAAPIPAPIRTVRERPRPSFDTVPLNPLQNPIFANKRSPPAPKKKKGLLKRIMKKFDDDSDSSSDLTFHCVGLPQEQLTHPKRAHGEGAWWGNDLVMMPN